MQLAAFFHVWADGKWEAPLDEFRAALGDFDGPVFFGLVGSALNCNRVVALLEAVGASPAGTPPVFVACEPQGFEAVTLNVLRDYTLRNAGAVLYAHTKGSATVDPFRDRWRRAMLGGVVEPWRENLARLEDHDAVGCHWLTEDEFPGMFDAMTEPAPGSGFFGGNFWMARCDYVRRLPPVPSAPRWQAEAWIGWGYPRVVNLLPGWPHDNRWNPRWRAVA